MHEACGGARRRCSLELTFLCQASIQIKGRMPSCEQRLPVNSELRLPCAGGTPWIRPTSLAIASATGRRWRRLLPAPCSALLRAQGRGSACPGLQRPRCAGQHSIRGLVRQQSIHGLVRQHSIHGLVRQKLSGVRSVRWSAWHGIAGRSCGWDGSCMRPCAEAVVHVELVFVGAALSAD